MKQVICLLIYKTFWSFWLTVLFSFLRPSVSITCFPLHSAFSLLVCLLFGILETCEDSLTFGQAMLMLWIAFVNLETIFFNHRCLSQFFHSHVESATMSLLLQAPNTVKLNTEMDLHWRLQKTWVSVGGYSLSLNFLVLNFFFLIFLQIEDWKRAWKRSRSAVAKNFKLRKYIVLNIHIIWRRSGIFAWIICGIDPTVHFMK